MLLFYFYGAPEPPRAPASGASLRSIPIYEPLWLLLRTLLLLLPLLLLPLLLLQPPPLL